MDAATSLLFTAMRRNFPSRAFSEVLYIHNGQGLKREDRDNQGDEDVFGSGGWVGKHIERMHPGPFVVIGRKGSAGKATFATRGGWVTDTAYFATPLNAEELDCKFMFYAIKSQDFDGDIISTAIPGINQTAIYVHSLPLPPLQVQITVAKFLDAVAERPYGTPLPMLPPQLVEQRRILAWIEELAAKIQKARDLRKQAAEEAEALAGASASKLFKEFTERFSIETIAEVRGGIQKGPHRAPGANPVRYLTVTHVQRNQILTNNPRFFEVTQEELSRWRLLPGDVLIIEGNGSAEQIGRTALFRGEIENCVHQNHVIRIRLNQQRVLPEFLNSFLNSPAGQDAVQSQSRTTSGLRTLSVGRIKAIAVPVPALSEQRRIVAELDTLQSKVDALKRLQSNTATELDALMPSILDKAFRGEL